MRTPYLFMALSAAGLLLFAACSSSDLVATTAASNDAGEDAATTDGATPLPGCVDGKAASAYPADATTIDILKALPDLAFVGVESDGVTPKTYSLHDVYDPCSPQSKLLLIRVSAAWCGTCRWSAANTARIKDLDIGSRIQILDLLIANEDNNGVVPSDLSAWRKWIDKTDGLAIDPSFSLRKASVTDPLLPLVVAVDVRTMKVVIVEPNPDPDYLAGRLRRELETLDNLPVSPYPTGTLHDELFTADQWGLLREITLPTSPPPDPTNEFADSTAAAAFGKELFFDKSLSPSGKVACSTCHDPAKQLADGEPQAIGVSPGDRNTPQIALAAHSRWQFWDGRADSLWAQALGPFENDKEFASSRLFVAHQIADRYAATYAALFGKYPLPDLSALPASGKPGDPTYDALPSSTKEAITRVYVNTGKAIAAFERTFRVEKNAVDDYIAGDSAALSQDEKEALQIFAKVGCLQCHYGPRLTDDAFHNIQFPSGRRDLMADRGRIDGVQLLLANEFLGTSTYSDSPNSARPFTGLVAEPSNLGAFRTPSLRGISNSAPFGHGGTLATLHDVTKHYGRPGLPPGDPRSVGALEPWVGHFDTHAEEHLVHILNRFAGTPSIP